MLLTSKNSEFNKISPELKAELDSKKLSKGQQVQFRLLDPAINPDPEERLKPGKELIWRQGDYIGGKDRIKDPYSGELVDIGVVDTFDKEGTPKCKMLNFSPRDTNGYITIIGGDIKTEEFYEFMLLANENQSNPHRDTNVRPKFKFVDAAKDSQEINQSFDDLTDMLILVKSFSPAERREVALAYGWDGNSGDDIILRRLREIVKADPKSFKKTVGNKKDLSVRAVLHEALSAGVITYGALENKYTFAKTNEVIATFQRSETAQPIDQLLEWIKTSPKGTPVI